MFLLQVPKNVNVKDFIGKKIPLGESGKIRLHPKEKLQFIPQENRQSSWQIISDSMVQSVLIERIIETKKRMKKFDPQNTKPLEKNLNVETITKQRHPIFSSSFNEDLAMVESAIERLDKIKKKKQKEKEEEPKKKKKKHTKETETGVLSWDEPKKKKKKHHEELQEVVSVNPDFGDELKLKKKKKKHQEEEVVVYPETPKKKKKKQDKELDFEVLSQETQKKAKKNKKTEQEESVKPKKKHKHTSEDEESDIDVDVFSILSEAKQKILGTS